METTAADLSKYLNTDVSDVVEKEYCQLYTIALSNPNVIRIETLYNLVYKIHLYERPYHQLQSKLFQRFIAEVLDDDEVDDEPTLKKAAEGVEQLITKLNDTERIFIIDCIRYASRLPTQDATPVFKVIDKIRHKFDIKQVEIARTVSSRENDLWEQTMLILESYFQPKLSLFREYARSTEIITSEMIDGLETEDLFDEFAVLIRASPREYSKGLSRLMTGPIARSKGVVAALEKSSVRGKMSIDPESQMIWLILQHMEESKQFTKDRFPNTVMKDNSQLI